MNVNVHRCRLKRHKVNPTETTHKPTSTRKLTLQPTLTWHLKWVQDQWTNQDTKKGEGGGVIGRCNRTNMRNYNFNYISMFGSVLTDRWQIVCLVNVFVCFWFCVCQNYVTSVNIWLLWLYTLLTRMKDWKREEGSIGSMTADGLLGIPYMIKREWKKERDREGETVKTPFL